MDISTRVSSVVEGCCCVLLFAALATIQMLVGGTRMVFSLPSFAVLGIVGLLALFLLRLTKPLPSQSCLIVTALFFAYILVRAWLSPVPYITRSDIHSVLAGLIVYFFVACFLTNGNARMLFISSLLALAVGHVIIGVLQFRDGANFMPISWLRRYDYGVRASGFYVCPNHLAGLLEALGIIGLSMVCWSRWPTWAKVLLGYAVSICYLGLVLTGSRGGYLSTPVSLVVFAILSLICLRRVGRQVFWRIGGAAIMAAVLITVVVFFFVQKSDFLSGRAQNSFETTNMRVDLWKGALQQWKLQPIFGTGSGTYLYFGRLFRTERVQQDPVFVHNDYLHLLAEYGLIGGLGMAAFLAAHLWHGRRSFRRLGPKRVVISSRVFSNALALNIGAISAVAAYLAHSIVDFNLHIPANLLLMAFVFGMLANDGALREKEADVTSPSFLRWRLALPLLGLLTLVQSLRLLPGEYFAEHARTALRDGQAVTSIRYAVHGLRYDPHNPDLYYHLGSARMLAGARMTDPRAVASFQKEAINALEQARLLAPRDEVYALELAAAFDAAARYAEAEWVYYEARQLDPKSISIRRYYDAHLQLWRGEDRTGGAQQKGDS